MMGVGFFFIRLKFCGALGYDSSLNIEIRLLSFFFIASPSWEFKKSADSVKGRLTFDIV